MPDKKSRHKTARRWLFKRAGTARFWILLSVVLGLGSGLLLVVQARFLARIVHAAFIEGLGIESLWPLFSILAAVILLRSILGWARETAGFRAGAEIRQEVRTELLAHIFRLGPGYTSRQSSGALAATALEQVEGLHDFYAFYLPQLALAVMIPAAIAAFVFPYSWAAGGLLLVTAPLIPLFMILVGMGAESISQRHFQALSRMSGYFLDVLRGITTLKLFYRSKGTEETIAEVSNQYRMQTMRVLRVAFLSSAVLEFFSSISIALVAVYLAMSYLGYLSFGLYGQSLDLAGGLFILLLAPDFYLPLRELGTHYHARAEAVGAAEEILKILSVSRDTSLSGMTEWTPTDPLYIQMENVRVAFDRGQRPALQDVSLELRQGERVALVGASGTGKTTVLNCLLGFLRPDGGQINVNGLPLAELTPASWRRQIAWMGQHPILFQGTIEENIRLGRGDADAPQVEQAAANAGVLDFSVHLPEGLNTMVGEHGYGLSRGQAQRVALARAFLKDAPMLLLDEPTAGLDAENEAVVIRALENLSQGRTVLLLTHRLTNIRQASRILVLDKGRIVEQGTYDELSAAGGRFQRMVNQMTENRGQMTEDR